MMAGATNSSIFMIIIGYMISTFGIGVALTSYELCLIFTKSEFVQNGPPPIFVTSGFEPGGYTKSEPVNELGELVCVRLYITLFHISADRFWAFWCFCFLFPISVVCVLLGNSILYRSTKATTTLFRGGGVGGACNAPIAATMLYFSAEVVVGCVCAVYLQRHFYGADDLLGCGVIGCVWSSNGERDQTYGDHSGFRAVVGMLFLLACVGLATLGVLLLSLKLNACIVVNHSGNAGDHSGSVPLLSPNTEGASIEDRRGVDCRFARKGQMKYWAYGLLSFLVVFPATLIGSTILPADWQKFDSNHIPANARLKFTDSKFRCVLATYPLEFYSCAEVGGAMFRTIVISLPDGVEAKLFPDVLMFYGFIYILALLGLCSACSERVRLALRVRLCVVPSKLPLVGGATLHLGQVVVGMLFATTLSLFVAYWYLDHNYHHTWGVPLKLAQKSATEKAARTAGQVANLFLGLLLLPAARNSTFSHLFGISWERAIRSLHVVLGGAFIVVVLLHAFLWWVTFAELGIFPHDALAIKPYYPLNFGSSSTPPNADNFTVPLATVTWWFVLLPTFGVLSLWPIRRAFFEVFYYTHHLAFVLLLVVLFHAPPAPSLLAHMLAEFRLLQC